MALVIITAPTVSPVSTAEFKTHHRIDFDKDDTLIDLYIKSATQYAERYMSRAIVTQTLELVLDEFPPERDAHRSAFTRGHSHSHWHPFHRHHRHHRNDVINIPRPPLQSITSIKYIDEDGVEQTLASTEYDVDTSSEPARVFPAFEKTWPVTRDVPNAVKVRYDAGYGLPTDSPLKIPDAVSHGIKLLASGWYENRESLSIVQMRSMPFSVDALLWMYRVKNMGPLNNDWAAGR